MALANNTHFSHKLSHPGETALELNYEEPMGICSLSGIKPSILQNAIESKVLLQTATSHPWLHTVYSVNCKQPSPPADKGAWTLFALCFIRDKSSQCLEHRSRLPRTLRGIEILISNESIQNS